MNESQKNNLRKALAVARSGELGQCQHGMRDDDGRVCFLGLLCEVFRRETGQGCWESGYFVIGTPLSQYLSSLPPQVQEWYGFSSGDPSVGEVLRPECSDEETTMLEVNDRWQWGFRRIAEATEQHYLEETHAT